MSAGATIAVWARFGRQPILDRIERSEGVAAIVAEDVEALIGAIPQADALALTNPSRAEGARIAKALSSPDSRVRWIQALSAGFDGLLDQPLPAGLEVTGQAGAMAQPVAEHAIGLLLGMTRGLFEIGSRSRAKSWNRDFTPPLFALEGRSAAIIGFGSIGRAVARRLRAFEMRVIAVSRSAPPEGEADQFVPLAELHAALSEADVVLVTIALAPETRLLFDAAAFAACKPGAYFVNVARGEIVDQVALALALESGRLAGAALDVTSPEPLPPGDPLWDSPRLIVSPHVAGAGSPLAGKRIAAAFAENLARFSAGERLQNRIGGSESQ
jgi:phosphoglycerate dehydrogenase-like enzyme